MPLAAARQTPNLEDQWLEIPTPVTSGTSKPNLEGQWLELPTPATRFARRLKRRERTPAEEGETMAEKFVKKFAGSGDVHVTFVFFYMPEIYDMGPTALVPLRMKACWGFFRSKNPTASVPKPARLRIDHRSRNYKN